MFEKGDWVKIKDSNEVGIVWDKLLNGFGKPRYNSYRVLVYTKNGDYKSNMPIGYHEPNLELLRPEEIAILKLKK